MRARWLLVLLAFVSCKRDSVLRVAGRAKIVSHPLSSPLNWEHAGASVFVECDGRRVAEAIGTYSTTPEFIATSESSAPEVLVLIDTGSCDVSRPLNGMIGEVEWNAADTLGFVTAKSAYVIHATRPPTLEKVAELPWLAVGVPFQASAWSGDFVLLKRFEGERCFWATWNVKRGFEPFEFTEDVCREVKLAWRGQTPTVVMPDGRVVEPKR